MSFVAQLGGTTASHAIKENKKGDVDRAAMNCEKASKILTERKPMRKLPPAYDVIVKCPGGAAALAAAWTPPPTDRTLLRELTGRSIKLSDRRILDATLTVVRNTEALKATRRAAIDVVLRQYDPTLRVGSATWENSGRPMLGHYAYYWQVPGEQAVTAADRQRIVNTFRTISIAEPDAQIRGLAMRLVTEFGRPEKEEHDCKKAITIVRDGQPINEQERAWAIVFACGTDGAAAVRDAWLALRTETKTSRLEAHYNRVWSFRDAALFGAAGVSGILCTSGDHDAAGTRSP